MGLKRAGLLTASLFGVVVQASLLRSSSWSWLHWDWIGGTQLEGSREQSYVPAPGYCAQEFENAAILNLVTTFLPLPARGPCQPYQGLSPPVITLRWNQEAQLRLPHPLH